MALCKLTLNWNDGEPVWVNPAQVVAFWGQGGGTAITTAATGREGTTHTITVTEQPDHVAALLDQASAN